MTDEERVELALTALAEIVDPAAVGPLVDAGVPAPGVVDLRFASLLPGYVDWYWTVSTSDLDGVEPTVLELELLPGDGALVAPAWVPWEERLAEWRRSHAADGPEDDSDEDDDDSDEDEDEDEDDDLDEDEDEPDEDDDLDEDDDVLDDDVDVDAAAEAHEVDRTP